MDQLRALRYFCKVVETGSFTQAVLHRQLGFLMYRPLLFLAE